MSKMTHYLALNGTYKVQDTSKMHSINGARGIPEIMVRRHCGGILALRMTQNGAVEITKQALMDRLAELGAKLPWEEA